jgi:hypothetical protein
MIRGVSRGRFAKFGRLSTGGGRRFQQDKLFPHQPQSGFEVPFMFQYPGPIAGRCENIFTFVSCGR